MTKAIPCIACSADTIGAGLKPGSIAAICAVSPPRLGCFEGLHVVLEHEVMYCLLEF